jgi:hypothetical protein
MGHLYLGYVTAITRWCSSWLSSKTLSSAPLGNLHTLVLDKDRTCFIAQDWFRVGFQGLAAWGVFGVSGFQGFRFRISIGLDGLDFCKGLW